MALEAQMSFGMGSNRRWTRQRIELAVIGRVKFPIRSPWHGRMSVIAKRQPESSRPGAANQALSLQTADRSIASG
jgi:hypothetical protein